MYTVRHTMVREAVALCYGLSMQPTCMLCLTVSETLPVDGDDRASRPRPSGRPRRTASWSERKSSGGGDVTSVVKSTKIATVTAVRGRASLCVCL